MYPLATLAKYGTPHRCFDHIVVAVPGMVVAIPAVLVSGSLKDLPLTCPVPWHEMWSILDTEAEQAAAFDLDLFVPPLLHDLGIAGECYHAAALPEYAATVFALYDGLRLGISNDYVHKAKA